MERVSRSDSPRKSRTGDKRPQVGKSGKDTWAMDPLYHPLHFIRPSGTSPKPEGLTGGAPASIGGGASRTPPRRRYSPFIVAMRSIAGND